METALVETTLVAPHCAGTSRICGKIKKSNVLHYICHFTKDKNNFLYSCLFFSLTWAENEHWQPREAFGLLRLSNLSFPAHVRPENNLSHQKLFSSSGKWQMNEVKYYCCLQAYHDKGQYIPKDFFSRLQFLQKRNKEISISALAPKKWYNEKW